MIFHRTLINSGKVNIQLSLIIQVFLTIQSFLIILLFLIMEGILVLPLPLLLLLLKCYVIHQYHVIFILDYLDIALLTTIDKQYIALIIAYPLLQVELIGINGSCKTSMLDKMSEILHGLLQDEGIISRLTIRGFRKRKHYVRSEKHGRDRFKKHKELKLSIYSKRYCNVIMKHVSKNK
jgi:hypothetical protein